MKLNLSPEKMKFLKSIGIEDQDYTQDEIEDVIVDKLVSYLMSYGWEGDIGDKTNRIGDMCENIIDEIYEKL